MINDRLSFIHGNPWDLQVKKITNELLPLLIWLLKKHHALEKDFRFLLVAPPRPFRTSIFRPKK